MNVRFLLNAILGVLVVVAITLAWLALEVRGLRPIADVADSPLGRGIAALGR